MDNVDVKKNIFIASVVVYIILTIVCSILMNKFAWPFLLIGAVFSGDRFYKYRKALKKEQNGD